MGAAFRTSVAIFLGTLLLLPGLVSASGLMIPPPDTQVYQTGQESVLFYEDGQQDMLLSASFRGNAEQFAWLVPTPSIPKVRRGSWEMFVALRGITGRTTDDYRLSGYGAATSFEPSDYLSEPAMVEVERSSVGYYDITVLEARTTEALLEWFEQNGYDLPADGRYVLDEYIEAGWYFTAVTLNTENISSRTADDILKGNSLPLHFQFQTEKMVFPMQLSQLARLYSKGDDADAPKLKENIDITLYLISQSRRSLPGFTQSYAGYISGQAVSELSYSTDGEPLIEAKPDERYVITRLSRSFPITEMTYDLYPRKQDNIGVLNQGERGENTSLWLLAGLAGAVSIVLIGAITLMARDKEPSTKKD